MKKLTPTLIIVIVFSLLTLVVFRTFVGDHYFDGHDSQAHMVRLYQFDKALKDGQFPPRLAGDLYGGRGYPVFNFTYQLPYFIAEGFHLLGASLAVSLKLTFVLAYFTSTIGVFLFASRYWSSQTAGFLSALLWSWAPPIFETIFIGGALGAVVSFAFIPYVFLAIFKLASKPNLNSSLALAILISCWQLSHLLTLIIFTPLMIFFALHLLWPLSRIKRIQVIGNGLLAIFLALLFSAWYFLPAMGELNFTHFKDFVSEQYFSQFVSFSRLIYSRWGTDAPGWGSNPVSQQVGIAQWLAIVATIITALFARKNLSQVMPFLLGFILSIFLMLSLSEPVWQALIFLRPVGTPWRFLSLTVFTAALSSGYVITVTKKPLYRYLLFSLLAFLTLYGNRNHIRINEKRYYSQEFLQNYQGVATGWNEHLPIWVKDYQQGLAEPLVTNCLTSELVAKSNLVTAKIRCSKDSPVIINKAYFPGWTVQVNGQDVTEQVKANLATANGVLLFDLPQGEHQIKAEFGKTKVRLVSELISLATFLSLIIFYTKKRFLSRPQSRL